MTPFIVIIWALVGVVVGAMLGGELADLGASHRGNISTLFVGALVGALLGAVGVGSLGRMLALKFAADRRKLTLLAHGPWIGAAVAVLGIVLFEEARESLRNPDLVQSDGTGLSLIYEIRLPSSLPAPSKFLVELRTPDEVMQADSARVLQQQDRVVIQGHFWVYKATPKRIVAFRLGDGPTALFTMHLAARPANHGGRWSNWQRPDEATDSTRGKSPRAPPDETIEIRYAANY